MHARHVAELAALRNEIDELRDVLQLVVGILRVQAESDVRTLRRQLTAVLARLERDPAKPLH
jgi:hypothetical protein